MSRGDYKEYLFLPFTEENYDKIVQLIMKDNDFALNIGIPDSWFPGSLNEPNTYEECKREEWMGNEMTHIEFVVDYKFKDMDFGLSHGFSNYDDISGTEYKDFDKWVQAIRDIKEDF